MKKKVVSIAITVGMTISAGTILANTDAGMNLANWYKGSFQQESDAIAGSFVKDLSSGVSSVKQFVSDTNKEMATTVRTFQENIVFDTKSEMERHQNHYEEQLSKTKSELKHVNLDDYSTEAQNREQQAIEEEMETILAEILSE